jgi:hypothetical protein
MRKHPRERWWQHLADLNVDGPSKFAINLKFTAVIPRDARCRLYAGLPFQVPPAQMRRHPIGAGTTRPNRIAGEWP